MTRRPRSPLDLAVAIIASIAAIGCDAPGCPAGLMEEAGACVPARDGGQRDVGSCVGATETCDGSDEDCDGVIDEGFATSSFFRDADSDGHGGGSAVVACVAPAGHVASGEDCDDRASDVAPGRAETCDGRDQDCDVEVDEGLPLAAYHRDGDGDGAGDPAMPVSACAAPDGFVTDMRDCDDTDAAIAPGAAEACDGIDQDCDAILDEGSGVITTFHADADGDGYGDPASPRDACAAPPDHAPDPTDCDDSDDAVHPGASELCDERDQDCDGAIDEHIQGTVGTPLLLRDRMLAERGTAIAPLASGYAIVYTPSSGGPVAHRLDDAGALTGTAVALAGAASDSRVALLAIDGTTAIAATSTASGSQATIRLHRIAYEGATITVGAPVTVATSARNGESPALALDGSTLVVAWPVSFGPVEARTYSSTLGSPGAVATLFSGTATTVDLLSVPGSPLYLLMLVVGRRPGDTADHAYLDRVQSGLSVEGRVTRVASGVSAADAALYPQRVGAGRPDVALAWIRSGSAELARLSPGAPGSAFPAATTMALDGGGTTPVGIVATGSPAGIDVAFHARTATNAVIVSVLAAGDGTTTAPAIYGASHYVPGLAIARRSSRDGIVLWASTALASTPPSSLWAQRIGCE